MTFDLPSASSECRVRSIKTSGWLSFIRELGRDTSELHVSQPVYVGV
jgi:hypothetical protein